MANKYVDNSAGTRGGFRAYFRKQMSVLVALGKVTQKTIESKRSRWRVNSPQLAGEFVVKEKMMCSKICLLVNVNFLFKRQIRK